MSKTIIFFGSGPVAAESLQQLAPHFKIEAVITKPRPPHHKGSVPVIDVAKQRNLPLYTASNKQELHDLVRGSNFTSDVGVLIDFAIIVLPETIALFKKGIVNSHFSLLPEWRGPDPISFAVLSGQKYSGTSLMLLAPGVDEGLLLSQERIDLPSDITTPELTDKLIRVSTKLLIKNLPLYLASELTPYAQDQATIAPSSTPSYSRKLTKEDGFIDWHKSAEVLEREVRAFLGWPGSRTTLFGKDIIVTQAKALTMGGTVGKVITEGKKRLIVGTSKGSLEILRLKPAGKKDMSATAFLAGLK